MFTSGIAMMRVTVADTASATATAPAFGTSVPTMRGSRAHKPTNAWNTVRAVALHGYVTCVGSMQGRLTGGGQVCLFHLHRLVGEEHKDAAVRTTRKEAVAE